MSTTTDLDDFTARRQAWKAAGCPSDHPYMVECRAAVAAPAAPVVPLVAGITAEMVTAAAELAPMMPERPHWPRS